MQRPRSLAKLAAVAALALSGFALAGIMAGSGLATDPTTSSGTDTGSTSGTTDTGTTSTGTTETQPPGGGGCTPGYWKNHTENWVGYTPAMSVGSVFSNATGSLGSMTLLEALKQSGGDTLEDAKRLLIHHAVAALLNSTHPDVDYAFTTAQVISWTNAALLSSDRDEILALKDLFDAENNRGCTVD